MALPKPINDTQRQFEKLCSLGGGRSGGPARTKVQQLLHESGAKLNVIGRSIITEHLTEFSDVNPWYVCFAVGLSWGHLAKPDIEFTRAAIRALQSADDADVNGAALYYTERGPEPIKQSIRGGHQLFSQVKLPDKLPDDLKKFGRAQERWVSYIISPNRPKYIGSWNATAMFMVALFSKPDLVTEFKSPVVMLPPGGPIFSALKILHQTHILSRSPAGSELDDQDFEPGSIYENNALLEELLKGHSGWNMLDVHSGLYMLGTRFLQSNQWF